MPQAWVGGCRELGEGGDQTPQFQAQQEGRGGAGLTHHLFSLWERNSGSSNQAPVQPQQPKGHGHPGKRRQNSSTFPGSWPPTSPKPVPCVEHQPTGTRTSRELIWGILPLSPGTVFTSYLESLQQPRFNHQKTAQRWEVTCPRELLRSGARGLPCWLSGKESACQCRRHGFNPWSGKILRAIEQLSPCPTAAEPVF